MSAPHLTQAPTAATPTRVAELLATAYLTLQSAAVTAGHLVTLSPTHRGVAGWDLELNIHDAAAAIEHAVCVHDLATYHPFWTYPQLHVAAATARAGARARLAPSTQRVVDTIIGELGAIVAGLSEAEEHADALVADAHHYANHHGYIGGLGWDLQTAVDDALIAVRTAICAVALAETTAQEALQ